MSANFLELATKELGEIRERRQRRREIAEWLDSEIARAKSEPPESRANREFLHKLLEQERASAAQPQQP